jgi:ABC-type transporter Mla subunit MlaD
MSYWTIFGTLAGACSFGVFTAYLYLRRKIGEADTYILGRELALESLGPEATSSTEAPQLDGSLRSSMQRYEHTFYGAMQRRILPQFSVEEASGPVYRASLASSGMLRPFAGWFLLLGLIITLWNLQGAVGILSGAFHDITVAGPATSSGTSAQRSTSARDRERNVTDKMSNMASAASRAFRTSLWFILLSLACMVLAVLTERRAKLVLIRFETWASNLYQHFLPSQLPITEGDIARKLTETVNAMQSVAAELQNASGQLASLSPLVGTMSGATDAIQDAMRQLPKDLQSSMSNVTSDLVKGLTATLGESNEYTKRILAIYAEQELRVRGLDAVLKAVQSSLKEIKESHQLLSALPDQQAEIMASSKGIAASAEGIRNSLDLVGKNTERISALVERLPVFELAQAVDAIRNGSLTIEELKTRIGESNSRLHSAIEAQLDHDSKLRGQLEDLSQYLMRLHSMLDGKGNEAKRAYAENIKQLVLDQLTSANHSADDVATKEMLLQIASQIRSIRIDSDTDLSNNGGTW